MNADRIRWLSYILVPLVQVCMIVLCLTRPLQSFELSPVITLVFAALLCVAADALFFRSMLKSRKNALLSAKLQFLEYQMRVQRDYYLRLQANTATFNRMKQDLDARIDDARRLFSREDSSLALEQLFELNRALPLNLGSVFCANTIVDAVLLEKSMRCREDDIALSVDAVIPDGISLSGAHLCSVFANILDNAIAACKSCAEQAVKPYINLRSCVKSGCLVVHCENSALPPSDKKAASRRDPTRDAHGLGLGILQKIVDSHNGRMTREYKDGSFVISVTLPLDAPEPESLDKQKAC